MSVLERNGINAYQADEDGHLTQLEGAGGAAAVHSAQASQADVLR